MASTGQIPRGWLRLSGVCQPGDPSHRKRSGSTISPACRPVAPYQKWCAYPRGSNTLCKPPCLVAMREGSRLSGCYCGAYPWQRLSLLRRSKGSAGFQRSRYSGDRYCKTVAYYAEWRSDTADGYSWITSESLVGMQVGPRLEGGSLFPDRPAEMWLPCVRWKEQ